MRKKVLVTGGSGQLAQSISACADDYQMLELCLLDSLAFDLTNFQQVERKLLEIKPEVIINTAAYTAVDQAETDIEKAYAVNELAVVNLAELCKERQIKLIHISTDFVFNGEQSIPYKIQDKPTALNVYGASKLAGEKALLKIMPQAVIIRTSWLYSIYGHNFVKTILELLANKPELSVINDQVGAPTHAINLAHVCLLCVFCDYLQGIYHCTDEGSLSWYDFAVAIQKYAHEKGCLPELIPIKPVSSDAYLTAAKRPKYSVLDSDEIYQKLQREKLAWDEALHKMLDQYFLNQQLHHE